MAPDAPICSAGCSSHPLDGLRQHAQPPGHQGPGQKLPEGQAAPQDAQVGQQGGQVCQLGGCSLAGCQRWAGDLQAVSWLVSCK